MVSEPAVDCGTTWPNEYRRFQLQEHSLSNSSPVFGIKLQEGCGRVDVDLGGVRSHDLARRSRGSLRGCTANGAMRRWAVWLVLVVGLPSQAYPMPQDLRSPQRNGVQGNRQGDQRRARPPVAAAQASFDRLQHVDGSVWKGLVVGENPQAIFFACRRAWLIEHDPGYKALAKSVRDLERQAYTQLQERLDASLKEPADPRIRFMLEQEMTRAQGWLAADAQKGAVPEGVGAEGREVAESELVLLELPRAAIAKVQRRWAPANGLAVWAWSKQIDAPESKSADVLRKELEILGVQPGLEPPDLGLRFQAMPQSDEEWAARLALLKYSRADGVEFQGTQGIMVRVDRGQPADVAKLLTASLQNQSQALMRELLGEKPADLGREGRKSWLEPCERQLADEPVDGFRATSVETSLLDSASTVQSAFVVRMPDGRWTVVWRYEQAVGRGDVRPELVREIGEDPQIQSLMKLVQPLGIANDEALQAAMAMGAATLQAQQDVNSRFEFYRQRYQHRLDLPILRWDPER